MSHFKKYIFTLAIYISSLSGADITSSLQTLQQSLHTLAAQVKPDDGRPWTKLSWWAKAIKKLPFLEIIKHPLVIETTIQYDDYIELLQEVAKQNIAQIGEKLAKDAQFFAAKVAVKAPATIYCWGDLHGDVFTLVESLAFLQGIEKVIDDNFKIGREDVFFVFNGDYVDRGWYGVEVQAILCLLKKNNPNNVFLMQGNHESLAVEVDGGFLDELCIKYKLAKEEFKEKFGALDGIWSTFYNSLPVVLYFGIQQKTKYNYLQFCHGGLDFYNPEELLAKHSKSADFAAVQRMELEKAVPIATELSDDSLLTYYYHFKKHSGFNWNDFQQVDQLSKRGRRGLVLGRDLSNTLLELSKSNIIAVFRGHQHNPTMPSLTVEKNRNIYKLPYMDKHFVFTSIATPTMSDKGRNPNESFELPGRGLIKIKIESDDPKGWKLTSIWSKCENYNPKDCETWSKEGNITLRKWESTTTS